MHLVQGLTMQVGLVVNKAVLRRIKCYHFCFEHGRDLRVIVLLVCAIRFSDTMCGSNLLHAVFTQL